MDAVAFREAVAAGRPAEALAIGTGELLPSLDDDWVLIAREEHRDCLCTALADETETAEAAGDLERALDLARQSVRVAPLDEAAHRRLMRLLADSGDRAAALELFDRLAMRLREELGIDVTRETAKLAEGIGRPPRLVEAPPLPSLLRIAGGQAFTGREPELSAAAETWGRARRGDRQLLLIAGQAGIGKTSLARVLAERAHEDGALVLAGACVEEGETPFQPVIEAIGPLLVDGSQVMGDELSAVDLVQLLGPGDPAPALQHVDDTAGHRLRVFQSVTRLVLRAADERPVLLLLEDVHWAGVDTLAMFAHLVRATDGHRVLVVGTYRNTHPERSGTLTRVIAGLRRTMRISRIVLSGLDIEEVGQLMRRRAGDLEATPEEVFKATGGNPFFLNELLLDAQERLHAKAPPVVLGGRGLSDPLALPESVKDVVSARIQRLDPSVGHLLTIAAAIGSQFDLPLLRELLAAPSEEVLDAVDLALDAELLRGDPDSPERMSFAHDLVRATLYGTLSGPRRCDLHGRIGLAVERLVGGALDAHVSELAHHFRAAAPAGHLERAVHYSLRAAEQAIGRFAYEQAAHHLRSALELLGSATGSHSASVLLLLGEAELRLGQPELAQEHLSHAADIARQLVLDEVLARCALAQAGLGVTITEAREAVVLSLQEALERLDADAHPALAARLRARLAVELYYEPPRARHQGLAEAAVALAENADDPIALLDVLVARRVALWDADHLEERREISERIVTLAHAERSPEHELQGLSWLIVDLAERGDMDGVRDHVDRYEGPTARVRLPRYAWYVPMWRATLATLEGRFDDSLALQQEARRLGRAAGDSNAEVFFDVQHCTVLWERGDSPDLRALPDRLDPAAAGATRASRALFFALGDRHAEARRDVDAIAADDFAALPRDVNCLGGMALLAEACALMDYQPWLEALYERMTPYAHHWALQARAVALDGCVHYYLGRVAFCMGALDDAHDHLTAARDIYRHAGARPTSREASTPGPAC